MLQTLREGQVLEVLVVEATDKGSAEQLKQGQEKDRKLKDEGQRREGKEEKERERQELTTDCSE